MPPARSQMIDKLVLVARANSKMLYAGWDEKDQQPVLSAFKSSLTTDALEALQFFTKSGSKIPTIDLAGESLSVAVVGVVGAVQDITDISPTNIAQDTIKITVRDQNGLQQTITLGELEALKMIGDGIMIFQSIGTVLDTADRQVAVKNCSLFLQGNYEDSRPDMILLIKATNDNLGNTIDTVLFISEIIKKLIANDRKQPSEFQKGYLKAEAQAEKEIEQQAENEGGVLSFFFESTYKEHRKTTLQNMFVDFFTAPTDGSGSSNPFLGPVENTKKFSRGTWENVLLLRVMATKMYMYARKKISRS